MNDPCALRPKEAAASEAMTLCQRDQRVEIVAISGGKGTAMVAIILAAVAVVFFVAAVAKGYTIQCGGGTSLGGLPLSKQKDALASMPPRPTSDATTSARARRWRDIFLPAQPGGLGRSGKQRGDWQRASPILGGNPTNPPATAVPVANVRRGAVQRPVAKVRQHHSVRKAEWAGQGGG